VAEPSAVNQVLVRGTTAKRRECADEAGDQQAHPDRDGPQVVRVERVVAGAVGEPLRPHPAAGEPGDDEQADQHRDAVPARPSGAEQFQCPSCIFSPRAKNGSSPKMRALSRRLLA
jgi:hypothetical protein